MSNNAPRVTCPILLTPKAKPEHQQNGNRPAQSGKNLGYPGGHMARSNNVIIVPKRRRDAVLTQ